MKKGTYHIRVEWGNCDPAKIVFYPNYFAWFDGATHRLFESVGCPLTVLAEKYGAAGFPLVEAKASFMSPSVVGDELVIESHIETWNRRSFAVSHTVFNKDKVVVNGSEIRVFQVLSKAGTSSIKIGAIPDELKSLFNPVEKQI